MKLSNPVNTDIRHDVLLDVQNLESPQPTILAGQTLEKMNPGEILKLLTNSDSSYRNIRIYTESMGHELLQVEKLYEVATFWIKKGDERSNAPSK